MKVTVCFGETRVVVPCGKGDITINDLQEKACIRYRRAIGKDSSYKVRIIKLENAADGGILDVEDLVVDVIEDKEKLVAVFNEENFVNTEWDQLSVASSEEKSSIRSPLNTTRLDGSNELEQRYLSVEHHNSSMKKNNSSERLMDTNATYNDFHNISGSRNKIKKSGHQSFTYNTGPRFNHIKPNGSLHLSTSPRGSKNSKSPASDAPSSDRSNSPKKKPNLKNQAPYFQRDVTSNQQAGNDRPVSSPMQEVYYTSGDRNRSKNANDDAQLSLTVWLYDNSRETRFFNDGNIEAISVREYIAGDPGMFVGLLVQSIKEKSSGTEGCPFTRGDVIIGINEHLLLDFDFNDAESLLTQSLSRSQVLFRILSRKKKQIKSPRSPEPDVVPARERITSASSRDSTKRTASSKRASPEKPASPVQNNRSLPRKSSRDLKRYTVPVTVELVKECKGLGFSLASKDSVIGEPGPIYIQQILKNGAAMKCGKLLIGDRLLEVNGVSTAGKSREDIVTQLRAIDLGAIVTITVGRFADNFPRKLKNHNSNVDHVINDDQLKDYLTLDIALNDTGSAGLGISLKGNQNTKTGQDLGIFVRSVLHGGAAWQDGRLRANDQLIQINGHSLRGVSNQVATDILRNSMSTEGNVRGMIEMVVCRRKPTTEVSRLSSDVSSDMSDLVQDRNSSLAADRSKSHSAQRPVVTNFPDPLVEDKFKRPENVKNMKSTLDRVRTNLARSFDSHESNAHRASFRRSQSTDLLTPAASHHSQQEDDRSDMSRDVPKSDVGPCLGIAKSSSLESLQTAVEVCSADKEQVASRPLPKSVRGRVLNDSFRAALNRSYDLSQSIPALKRMETAPNQSVQEQHYRIPNKPPIKPAEDNLKPFKKKKKFLSLFKSNKTKKQEVVEPVTNNSKLSEKDEHKRVLDAKKEEDYAKMIEEKERIEMKAREMREKLAEDKKKDKTSNDISESSSSVDIARSPSVPVTSMQKLQEFYFKENGVKSTVDDFAVNSSSEPKDKGASPVVEYHSGTSDPQKNRKRTKSENRKSTGAYNSLPRPTRHKNFRNGDSIEDKSSIHRLDNVDFYNRHKPTTLTRDPNPSPRALKDRSSGGQKSDDAMPRNRASAGKSSSDQRPPSGQRSKNHRRVQTHDPPKFTTFHSGSSIGSAVRWRDPSFSSKKTPTDRHSVYTEQPSAFSQYTTPRRYGAPIARKNDSISRRTLTNDPMWQSSRPKNNSSSSSVESNQTASSSGLGVTERNRHDKSPKSMPTNL